MLLTPETLYFQLGRGEKDIHDSGPNASKERTRSRGSALRAKADRNKPANVIAAIRIARMDACAATVRLPINLA